VIYRKIYAFYCIYFALLTARRIKLNDRIENVFDVAREFIALHSFFFSNLHLHIIIARKNINYKQNMYRDVCEY